MYKAAEDFERFYNEIAAEGINPHNIEMAYYAAVGHEKALKSCILKEQLEEEMGGGYSRDGMSSRGYSREGGYSSRRGYSRDGMPYDEGGDSYRRDSMGRYSRADGKQHMKEQVEILMRQAGTLQEKEMARKFMEMLDKT